MEIHNVIQGSPEWDALRAKCWTASIAPAMRGESADIKRDEAIAMAAVGTPREFSAWEQKNLLDKGREIEVAGRAIAEKMLGEELYPATATQGIPGLSRPLLVSLDGMIMSGETTYECKQYNAELFAAVKDGDCLGHRFQVVQGLLITNAKQCLFMCTDGTEANTATCWITLRKDDGADLIAGWKQFEADVKNYTPPPAVIEVVGATIKELPALMLRVEGRVVDSNLGVFRQAARELIGAIRMDLQSDQDFVDAEKAIKWLKDGEDRLELVKAQALSQTATIDELFRTIDEIRAGMREKRLALDKNVDRRKKDIRVEIVTGGRKTLAEFCKTLNDRLASVAKTWWPRGVATPTISPEGIGENFLGVIKNLRTIDSLRNNVNTELARCQIMAVKMADAIGNQMAVMAELAPQHAHLFNDATSLVLKVDLRLIVEDRLRNEAKRVADEEEARRKAQEAIQTAQQPPAIAHTAEAGPREQPAVALEALPPVSVPGASQSAPSQAVGAAACQIDTFNKFGVALRGDRIAILLPRSEMTNEDALVLAAWLVALAEHGSHFNFEAALEAVRNT